MSKSPKPSLSRLRDIGWLIWDPMGLNNFGEDWKGVSFADEYDTYLIKAAGMLENNASQEEVVGYLVWAKTEYMGLASWAGIHERAKEVVSAIRNDNQIWKNP